MRSKALRGGGMPPSPPKAGSSEARPRKNAPPLGGVIFTALIITGGLAMAQSPSALALGELDSDDDLLPDAWEQRYGLNPADPGDAELDGDGDRLTNRGEFFAGTDPTVYTSVAQMSDRAILDLFQGKAFLFFWEQSRPPYHFTPDKANYNNASDFSDNFNSIATTGFAMMTGLLQNGLTRVYDSRRPG